MDLIKKKNSLTGADSQELEYCSILKLNHNTIVCLKKILLRLHGYQDEITRGEVQRGQAAIIYSFKECLYELIP